MMPASELCFKSVLWSYQFKLFLCYSHGSSQKHSSQFLLSDTGETIETVDVNIEVTENLAEFTHLSPNMFLR